MATASIPFYPYRLFFLYIEPISALLGAFYAARPAEYLAYLTASFPGDATSFPAASFVANAPVPTPGAVSLYQLSNLYLLFALNEHFVLRATNDIRTRRALLFGLLVADLGHLCTMAPLGLDVFWKAREWNAMGWGSVAFVYAGATMRACFLLGVGLGRGGETKKGD